MSLVSDAKQSNLISSDAIKKYKIKIFGLGSIGSILTKQLVLTGFTDITGYDFDTVDADNIGSQEFKAKHIGSLKTDALKAMIKEDYDVDISVINGKLDEKSLILPEDNTIYFCAFDSIPARKLLWDKLSKFPIIWGETRIGRTAQRYYFVDLRKTDDESIKWKEEYSAALSPDQPMTTLKCGEKGCYASNAELVSKVVRQIVNIAENKDLTTLFVGEWGEHDGIYRKPVQEVVKEIIYD